MLFEFVSLIQVFLASRGKNPPLGFGNRLLHTFQMQYLVFQNFNKTNSGNFLKSNAIFSGFFEYFLIFFVHQESPSRFDSKLLLSFQS